MGSVSFYWPNPQGQGEDDEPQPYAPEAYDPPAPAAGYVEPWSPPVVEPEPAESEEDMGNVAGWSFSEVDGEGL